MCEAVGKNLCSVSALIFADPVEFSATLIHTACTDDAVRTPFSSILYLLVLIYHLFLKPTPFTGQNHLTMW